MKILIRDFLKLFSMKNCNSIACQKVKNIIFIIITCISLSCCDGQNCKTLPSRFTSYNQAINTIEGSNFRINESVNTSKSSWIRSAHYYNCNGQTGYFIIQEKNKIYIHANLPISVWQQFKKANSFGSFYNHYIKGKYRFYLN